MHRLVEIKCKACKIVFMPKSERNIYCCRKCFKKAFYHRKKAEELSNIRFPIFLCPSCGRKIELDFDPIKNLSAWDGFSCPFCEVLMISVSDEIITQESQDI